MVEDHGDTDKKKRNTFGEKLKHIAHIPKCVRNEKDEDEEVLFADSRKGQNRTNSGDVDIELEQFEQSGSEEITLQGESIKRHKEGSSRTDRSKRRKAKRVSKQVITQCTLPVEHLQTLFTVQIII